MDLRRHNISTMNEQDLDLVRNAAADTIRQCSKYDTGFSLQELGPEQREFLDWQLRLAQTQALVAISEELALARHDRAVERRLPRMG